MIPGVDRSRHNDPIPLQKLFDKGIQFVWVKIAQWTSGEDKAFNTTWQEAKSIPKLKRGGYYFFDGRYDGIEQCKQMLSFGVNFTAHGCIGGCVDVEDLVVFNPNGTVNKLATTEANQWVANNWRLVLSRLNDFLLYYQQQVGEQCWIYSYNNYLKNTFHGATFVNNPMWLSSLQANCPNRYDTNTLPQFWQNTYNWNGTDMDGDYFMGTDAELDALANVV